MARPTFRYRAYFGRMCLKVSLAHSYIEIVPRFSRKLGENGQHAHLYMQEQKNKAEEVFDDIYIPFEFRFETASFMPHYLYDISQFSY